MTITSQDNGGIINFYNNQIWADENPLISIKARFQQIFFINIREIGRLFIGPFFFPQRLNGNKNLHFLGNELPALLEDVELRIRRRMLFTAFLHIL